MKNTCKFIHLFFQNLLKISVSDLILLLSRPMARILFDKHYFLFNYFPKEHPGNSPRIYHTADCGKKFICNLGSKLRTNPK